MIVVAVVLLVLVLIVDALIGVVQGAARAYRTIRAYRKGK